MFSIRVFALFTLLALALGPLFSAALPIPGADTPSFYLIAVSSSSTAVLPVLVASGGGFATLTGSGQAIQNYFYQGTFRGTEDRSGNPVLRPMINTGFSPTGSCATFGQLGYFGNDSTNKCASYATFGIQSYSSNSQLGAQLTFNNGGSFYACGSTQDIWFKVNAGDGPSGCTAVDLYTVPVI